MILSILNKYVVLNLTNENALMKVKCKHDTGTHGEVRTSSTDKTRYSLMEAYIKYGPMCVTHDAINENQYFSGHL